MQRKQNENFQNKKIDSSSICSLLELGCESDMPIYIYIQTIILNFTTKQKKVRLHARTNVMNQLDQD